MSNDIQTKIRKQISWAMVNSHHNGLIARSSRSILECLTANDVMGVVTRTLDELGLSGGGQFIVDADGECLNFQFGGGLSLSYGSGENGFVNFDDNSDSDSGSLVFREKNFLLIISFETEPNAEREQLRDNLTILVDIVQGWISRSLESTRVEFLQRNQRVDLTIKMTGIIDCLGKVSQHLIDSHHRVVERLNAELLAQFPNMSLEPSQEGSIINIANLAMEKQKGLLKSQLNQNEDLRLIMQEVIKALVLVETQEEQDLPECQPSM